MGSNKIWKTRLIKEIIKTAIVERSYHYDIAFYQTIYKSIVTIEYKRFKFNYNYLHCGCTFRLSNYIRFIEIMIQLLFNSLLSWYMRLRVVYNFITTVIVLENWSPIKYARIRINNHDDYWRKNCSIQYCAMNLKNINSQTI